MKNKVFVFSCVIIRFVIIPYFSHSPTFFGSPITSYSSHIADIPSYTGYSSYPGIDPYSGYHDSHSDIGPISYSSDHHHHHDYSHYPDSSHYHSDHSDPSGHEFSSPPESPPSISDDAKDTASTIGAGAYRRVSKHRRRRSPRQQQIEYDSISVPFYYYYATFIEPSKCIRLIVFFSFLDFGELAFRFLGVDTMGCRKRFVCELDFRARANPITRLAYSFIG